MWLCKVVSFSLSCGLRIFSQIVQFYLQSYILVLAFQEPLLNYHVFLHFVTIGSRPTKTSGTCARKHIFVLFLSPLKKIPALLLIVAPKKALEVKEGQLCVNLSPHSVILRVGGEAQPILEFIDSLLQINNNFLVLLNLGYLLVLLPLHYILNDEVSVQDALLRKIAVLFLLYQLFEVDDFVVFLMAVPVFVCSFCRAFLGSFELRLRFRKNI